MLEFFHHERFWMVKKSVMKSVLNQGCLYLILARCCSLSVDLSQDILINGTYKKPFKNVNSSKLKAYNTI